MQGMQFLSCDRESNIKTLSTFGGLKKEEGAAKP